VLGMAAASLVVISLLVVVVGQAMLASGQVRLAAVDQQLTTAQGIHRQDVLQDSSLETPSRIISTALGTLHLVHPPQPTQLPYVSLTTPLATPKMATATPTSLPATSS
jgi:hypothetical protein